MFSRKKDTAKISDKTPVFHVRYIGNTETYVANGKGCSYAPVQRLWDNSPGEKHLRKVAVHINPMGISLRDAEKRENELGRDFGIEDISFCNTDRAVNERIFSWICRNQQDARLDCHAVLCSTKQKAQTMAIVLSRAFQIAYKDWRAHNRKGDPGKSGTRKSGILNNNVSIVNGSKSKSGLNDSPIASQVSSSPITSREGKVANTDLTSSPTLGSTSSQTSTLPIRPPRRRSTLPSAEVTIVSGDGSPKPVTSSSRPDKPSTSSGFMSSSILDPEVEEAIGSVDNLHADFDLEDSDTD